MSKCDGFCHNKFDLLLEFFANLLLQPFLPFNKNIQIFVGKTAVLTHNSYGPSFSD